MKIRCRQPGCRRIAGDDQDETDLMPGTCPRCFDNIVKPIFETAQSFEELLIRLIVAGLHPMRISKHLVRERNLYYRRN